ncbi:hypothetical protein [Eubacterium sp.]|uniref:hypothetical protein n=1 Tax=Eubacterium sp. TaxID=142586 RepID=UPI0015AF8FD1|nr:hypothetical protein [uncultured Eubacterium sp.]
MFREMRRVKRIFAIRFTISTDLVERNMIWLVTGITFAVLAVYSFFWIKFKMKMLVFKSIPLEKVMAMENSMYYIIRKRRGIWR